MLAYVAGVQRKEIRQGIACVKHQTMAGSDIGDDHKEIFSGDNALKAHDDAKKHNEPVRCSLSFELILKPCKAGFLLVE